VSRDATAVMAYAAGLVVTGCGLLSIIWTYHAGYNARLMSGWCIMAGIGVVLFGCLVDK